MADIKLGGTLRSSLVNHKLAYAKDIYDEELNKYQSDINKQIDSGQVGSSVRFLFNKSSKGVPALDRTANDPEGWTKDSPSLSQEEALYMTSGYKDNKTNTLIGEWAVPVRISGYNGSNGQTPIVTITFNIYIASNSQPTAPKGGTYDNKTQTFTPPTGWSITPPSGGIIWMSTATFLTDGTQKTAWSTPFQVTGENGKDGVDGTNIEFIYQLNKDINPNIATPTGEDSDGFVPDGWTDHPQGISEANKVEYVSNRQKKGGHWSAFSKPAIWSKWGTNGKDGDGVEYIFKLTTTADAPTVPTGTNTDDSVPDGWTDDPTGTSESNPYEWVCSRKYDGETKTWGAYKGSSADPTKASLWSIWQKGDTGNTGNHITTMYSYSASPSVKPALVADNINPGSNWGTAWPTDYDTTKTVWSIQGEITYDNKLVGTWQGPALVTGIPGVAQTPNYKVYIYQKNNNRPDPPAVGADASTVPTGWKDYPDSVDGNWWQCIGSVDGTTGKITAWSSVVNLNGKDGQAQDGTHVEFRFSVNSSSTTAPTLDKTNPSPTGWTTQPPTKSATQFMWMITATINPNGTLATNWSDPVCISGEQGPKGDTGPAGERGPAGSQGVSGIPGVDIELRYGLGTDTKDPYTVGGFSADEITNYLKNRNLDGTTTYYNSTVPTPTSANPYIWCVQARIQHQTNNDAGTLSGGTWSKPFRLSGVNGLPGAKGDKGDTGSQGPTGPQGPAGASGKRGQLVYPAGLYDLNTAYVTDVNKAPYVLDSKDGQFYVLNAVMSWKGSEQNNAYPSQNAAKTDGSAVWVKFDSFEAFYTKIGIIANGLIGSAVFNGDYMFSMTGLTGTQDVTRYGTPYIMLFMKRSATAITAKPDMTGAPQKNDYKWAPAGWTNGQIPDGTDQLYLSMYFTSLPEASPNPGAVTKDQVPLGHTETVNVYGQNYQDFDANHIYDGSFCPTFLVNLRTGEGHYAAGKIKFNADGTGSFGNDINWDSEGNFIGELWDKPQSGTTIKLPKIPQGCSKLVRMPFNNNDTSNPKSFLLSADNASATITTYKSKSSPTPMTATGIMQLTCPDKGMGIVMCNGYIDYNNDEQWQVGFIYYTPIEVEAATVTATVTYDISKTSGTRGTITLDQTTDLNTTYTIDYEYTDAQTKHQLLSKSTTITMPANTKTINFDVGNNVTDITVSTTTSSSSYNYKIAYGTKNLQPYAWLTQRLAFTEINGKRDTTIRYNLYNRTNEALDSTVSGTITYKYTSSGGGTIITSADAVSPTAIGQPSTGNASFRISAGSQTSSIIGFFNNQTINQIQIEDVTVVPAVSGLYWVY